MIIAVGCPRGHRMKLMKLFFGVMAVLLASIASAQTGAAEKNTSSSNNKDKKEKPEWSFVVSGDSRNCGNVIMPAIAASAAKNDTAFYWHLGDLRAIYVTDQAYQHEPDHRANAVDPETYLKNAGDDY